MDSIRVPGLRPYQVNIGFLHFQNKEAYGPVVHLNPMKLVNHWPVIGVDIDGGIGERVLSYK